MGTASVEVEQYLAELEHPLKDGVLRLREVILSSDLPITEHVKWNAPSFCLDGEDRVTFRLRPRDQLQLILHRGAAVRADTADFRFEDPDGLLTWLAPDRAVITFADLEHVAELDEAVGALVERWVQS